MEDVSLEIVELETSECDDREIPVDIDLYGDFETGVVLIELGLDVSGM